MFDKTQASLALAEIRSLQEQAVQKLKDLELQIDSSQPPIPETVVQDIMFKLNVGVSQISAVIDIMAEFVVGGSNGNSEDS